MNFTTQMEAARKGIVTDELKEVSVKEHISTEELLNLVAQGKVIIPCNKTHKGISPNGIGAMLKTKINVNLGVSRDCKNLEIELEKVQRAVDMGAEAIMDLSSYGDTRKFRQMLTQNCPAMIGTVPIYDAVVYYHKPLIQITTDEWIDIVLSAVDYNPQGYESRAQKLAVIQRLLPFVEKNLNLIELAPPGTGKSYLFGQISRYGWLVSGKVTRAKLIYDLGKKTDGIVSYKDFVVLDEIREADYMKDTELHSALQQIMENKKYNAPDGHEMNVDAGIVFLGNISGSAMNEYSNMFSELPEPFHRVPFLDRIHGFIKGWDLPRMNDDLKAFGWALNSEYFSGIMHQLRDDASYRAIVDARVDMPPKADTRDTEAIKRICTAYLKLLFPHARKPEDISSRDFNRYCLQPAMDMRAIIRIQMGIADDKEAGKTVPSFSVIDA